MKKKAILPNVFTALSLICGLFVIFKSSMVIPGEATYHQVLIATIILMCAAILDVMDGAVARAMKAESDFGVVFDCMADAVSFAVAPTVLILKTLSVTPGTLPSFCIMTSAMVYALSCVLRLVRFNVNTYHMQHDKEQKAEAKKYFTGLPSTAAAACATSMSLLLLSEEFHSLFDMCYLTRVYVAAAMLCVLGFFMISRWKFPSLKSFDFRVTSFKTVFLMTVTAAAILFGMLSHFPVVFALLNWGYFLVAVVLSILRIISGKRLKSLEDFEPATESDEE